MKKLLELYSDIDLEVGDTIEILRDNHPWFNKGDKLVLLHKNKTTTWKFKNLNTEEISGFRLASVCHPSLYNEFNGWKKETKTSKKHIFTSVPKLFYVSSFEENETLIRLLQNLGYKKNHLEYNENYNWILIDYRGVINRFPINPSSLSPISIDWLVPKFEKREIIKINGKSYSKEQYDKMLSTLVPLED